MDALERTLILMLDEDSALVLMDHGSIHYANATYSQLQFKLWAPVHGNVYVTTVKGYLEYGDIMSFMGKGYEKVVLAPFVLVAGDHAYNDMAGDDEDSPKSLMERAGFEIGCVVRGLDEFPEFRELFMEHIDKAIVRTGER